MFWTLPHYFFFNYEYPKKRAPSNFAFQACYGFIGTLNRNNLWNPVSPFWKKSLFVSWIWRTLEQVMNIFCNWHFHSASKEVFWAKKIFEFHADGGSRWNQMRLALLLKALGFKRFISFLLIYWSFIQYNIFLQQMCKIQVGNATTEIIPMQGILSQSSWLLLLIQRVQTRFLLLCPEGVCQVPISGIQCTVLVLQ